MIKQFTYFEYVLYSAPKIFYLKFYVRFDTVVHSRDENELNQRIAILKNLILSILTIMFYSVYEYTARLNVTNGTVNLTGELIKNLECETRVSRVVLWCICNG